MVKLDPPEALMQTVDVPKLTGGTNRDVAAWAIALQEALARANENIRAIREWAADERDR